MKQASLRLSLENLIGLILAMIILVATFFFVGNLLNLVATSKPEQATIDNFEGMVTAINQLVNANAADKKTFDLSNPPGASIQITPSESGTTQTGAPLFLTMPYYLQDNFGLVAFDTNQPIPQTCGLLDRKMYPTSCLKFPCICLSELKAASVSNYIQCETLKNVQHITVKSTSTNSFGQNSKPNYGTPRTENVGAGGDDLVVWSDCGLTGAKFQVRDVKIIRLPGDKEGSYNLLFDFLPRQSS